ncbi:hypothetical protein F5Y01DRAFT_298030 [Xylaria sp. FL0043]|nr:hypothetical protein F5Y01DRAFT_298030 [Xylaria sp. FL0043]
MVSYISVGGHMEGAWKMIFCVSKKYCLNNWLSLIAIFPVILLRRLLIDISHESRSLGLVEPIDQNTLALLICFCYICYLAAHESGFLLRDEYLDNSLTGRGTRICS